MYAAKSVSIDRPALQARRSAELIQSLLDVVPEVALALHEALATDDALAIRRAAFDVNLTSIKLAAYRTAVELGLANQPPDAPLLARWATRAGATSRILADQVVAAWTHADRCEAA